MRQNNKNNNRSRGRGGRKGPNPLTRSYESNGPDVKVRGTAQHIAEKYLSLARDALSAGDGVAAEAYFQHAEHYNRIIMAARAQQNAAREEERRNAVQPEMYQPHPENSEQPSLAPIPVHNDEPFADAGEGQGPHASEMSEVSKLKEEVATEESEQPKPRRRRAPPVRRRQSAQADGNTAAEAMEASGRSEKVDSILDNPPAFLMTD